MQDCMACAASKLQQNQKDDQRSTKGQEMVSLTEYHNLFAVLTEVDLAISLRKVRLGPKRRRYSFVRSCFASCTRNTDMR